MSELPQPTLETRRVVDLIPNPLQGVYFSRRSSEALQELAEIIRRNYFEPIDITPLNVILSGHQRRLAARDYLDMDEVPVRVRHDLHFRGPEAEEKFFIDANLASRQLTKLELVRAFLHGVDLEKSRRREMGRQDGDQGRVRDAIAARFGKKRKALEDLIPILSSPRKVQRAFEEGQLSRKEAKRIAAATAEQQAEIVKRIEQGTSARKAMDQVLGSNKRSVATSTQMKRWWRELVCRAWDLLREFPGCVDHILPSQRRGLQRLVEIVDKVRELGLHEPAATATAEPLPQQSQNQTLQKPKLLPKPKSKLLPKPTLPSAPVQQPKLLPKAASLPRADDSLGSAS